MKKYLSIFLIAIMTISLTACGDGSDKVEEPTPIENETEKKDEAKKENDNSTEKNEEDEEDEIENRSNLPESIVEKEATLYFVNDKYIETGSEDLDKFIPLEVKIEIKDGKIAESIIHALIAGPNAKDGLSTGIPKNLKLIDVNLKDKILLVNLSSEGLNGGSLEEELLIGQIVNSLLELDNVEGVKFLVDGEETESLMGHFDATETYTEKIE